MQGDVTLWEPQRRATQEARGWLVRLTSGAATQDDLRAFSAWRTAPAENEAAYRDVLAMWEMLGPALTDTDAEPDAEPTVPVRAAQISRRGILAGAGLAVAAVIAVPLAVTFPYAPAGATVLETRKGERRSASLSRGVDVELNTDTRLVTWIEAGQRQVRLDRGEALVVVAYRAGETLRARARDTQVLASNARFLLSCLEGAPSVLCVGGKVEVRSDSRKYVLAADQSFRAGDASKAQREPSPAVDAALEWRRGVLVFKARPAGEIVAELNRYRQGHVFLPGERAQTPISGVIRLDHADMAVDHIAKSLGMRALRLPAGLILLR